MKRDTCKICLAPNVPHRANGAPRARHLRSARHVKAQRNLDALVRHKTSVVETIRAALPFAGWFFAGLLCGAQSTHPQPSDKEAPA